MKIFNIEEAVNQTLSRRYTTEIPNIVPDCFVDLTARKSGEPDEKIVNLAVFPKTGKTEMIDVNELSKILMERGVKTLGLLDSRCHVEVLLNEKLDSLKREIMESSRSYRLSDDAGLNADSCVFQGSGAKYYGYTAIFQEYSKRQTEQRFGFFMEKGGGIVSIQDRYTPISRFALTANPEIAEHTTLFCEITDYEIHMWVAADCGGMFSPLVTDFISDFSSVEFSIESLIAQATKQYRLRAPTMAVFIEGVTVGYGNHETHEKIKKLLADNCGKLIVWDFGVARLASLEGAVFFVTSARKKKKNEDGENALQVPRVNMVPKEWTHNYLIPVTLREFKRKGLSFIAALLIFICLCCGAYWFAGDISAGYAASINALQADTQKYVEKYANLKALSGEFSQIAEWRGSPDLVTQYSAVSSLLSRNNCLLIRSAFHSRVQDIQKTVDEIAQEVEQLTGEPLNGEDLAGIWELSVRLPVSGLNSGEARKNAVDALQKDAAALFGSPGSPDPANKSLLVLNGEQGNSMNILKNDSGMSAVLFVWKSNYRLAGWPVS